MGPPTDTWSDRPLGITPSAPPYHHPASTSYTKPTRTGTHTRNAKVSLLDDRIDILNGGAVEASPAKRVFQTVSTILALVRVSDLVLDLPVNSR